jgi:hypothetical protein
MVAKRSGGIGAGTDTLASTAHKVEAVFSGDDIAMGLTCQLTIGDRRSIVVQTHTTQSAEPAELNKLFDKIWAALDRVNARYRLKELMLNKKVQQDQMAMVMDNNSTTRQKWEAEWNQSAQQGKRRGGFVMNAQQINTSNQQQQMIERHKNEIEALDTEIRETQRLIDAG